MLLEINITSSCVYPVYKPHFRLRVLFWSRAHTSKAFSPLYYYIWTVWWISQTFVVQQSSMWTGCEGLHERSVFWRTGSLWMCAPSTPHPAFFLFFAPPLRFPGKDVCLFTGRLTAWQRGNKGSEIAHLTSCPYSLSHLFPNRRLFFLSLRLCTFPLPSIHVVCSHSPSLSCSPTVEQ